MSGNLTKADPAATERRRAVPGRRAWAAATLLAAAVLMFCYLRVAGGTQANSDGAGLVLEARSVLHGNVLLHGWWATDVSFYTTELPEYVGVTAVAGLRPEVVHICSALTYTLLVLLAAFVARGRARGAEGVVRALLAAGLILAPQPTGPTQVLLGSPDHVGTGVPVLLLLLLLDWAAGRPQGPRWYVPVGAGVLLSWAIIGDPLIEVVGVLPLFLASAVRAARALWPARRAAPRGFRPALSWVWSAAWYELSLAAAAVAAIGVKHLADSLLQSLGGIRTAHAWYHLLSRHEIIRGLPMTVRSVFALFGADYIGVKGAGNVAFACVHFIGVAVVLAAALAAAWRLLLPRRAGSDPADSGPADSDPAEGGPADSGRGDLVTGVLVLALAANLAAFVVDVPKPGIYSAHEIGPVLSLGAALAGRVLGGPILAGWTRAGRARSGLGRALLPALAAGLAGYAVMLGIAAAHPQVPPRNAGLSAWLVKHHLLRGLAPYWEASSITVDSGGKVTMLTVAPGGRHGHLKPRQWQSDVRLPYTMGSANFVIVSPAENVHRSQVLNSFGSPVRSYHYGTLTVMVWNRNLLPALSLPSGGADQPASEPAG